MFYDEIEPLRDEDRLDGPRRIGELMPAVLARHGIEIDRNQRRSGSPIVVFVPTTADFAIGVSELMAAQ
jgi:hypothetical protein